MYFENLNVDSSTTDTMEKEQMLIFEGDPYMEFPEEEWVAAPVNKGNYTLILLESSMLKNIVLN